MSNEHEDHVINIVVDNELAQLLDESRLEKHQAANVPAHQDWRIWAVLCSVLIVAASIGIFLYCYYEGDKPETEPDSDPILIEMELEADFDELLAYFASSNTNCQEWAKPIIEDAFAVDMALSKTEIEIEECARGSVRIRYWIRRWRSSRLARLLRRLRSLFTWIYDPARRRLYRILSQRRIKSSAPTALPSSPPTTVSPSTNSPSSAPTSSPSTDSPSISPTECGGSLQPCCQPPDVECNDPQQTDEVCKDPAECDAYNPCIDQSNVYYDPTRLIRCQICYFDASMSKNVCRCSCEANRQNCVEEKVCAAHPR